MCAEVKGQRIQRTAQDAIQTTKTNTTDYTLTDQNVRRLPV